MIEIIFYGVFDGDLNEDVDFGNVEDVGCALRKRFFEFL